MSEDAKLESAGVRCLGGELATLEVGAGNLVQHLTPHATEVLMLPFPIAKYLVQNRSTRWQALTVVPGSSATSHDPVTGLDSLGAVATPVWGIDPSGHPYYEDSHIAGADVASLTWNGTQAFLDGGYGSKSPVFLLKRRTRAWWRVAQHEMKDITLVTDILGTASVRLGTNIKDLEILDWMQASVHPNPELSVQEGCVVVTGATPEASVVIRYWEGTDDQS